MKTEIVAHYNITLRRAQVNDSSSDEMSKTVVAAISGLC